MKEAAPGWIVAALSIAVLTTVANTAMLVRQVMTPPPHPIYAAKELQKDSQFKKAVESIAQSVAQSQGYVDEGEVSSIIEGCKAVAGGKLKCN
jgi:hypothetical protein